MISSDNFAAGGLGRPAMVTNGSGAASIILVCEHASNFIPEQFDGLGLSEEVQTSHVAWDPGAMAVSRRLSVLLDAPLVSSRISRLVYDCNRPPSAPGAMPIKSEIYDIPGNENLNETARTDRVQRYYDPFRTTLADTINKTQNPILVTIHSFTPNYLGQHRAVEIGVLHDSDTRLADQMLASAANHTDMVVLRNAPYGPKDGVTHTLKEHATGAGIFNVMLEIRNDLISTAQQQDDIAQMLASWLKTALDGLGVSWAEKDMA